MSRLTISLDDALHQALKEAAARQGRSIGKIIEEGLILRGIKPVSTARDLVAKARLRSSIAEEDAMNLAVDEVRAERKN
ncbi:MAG: ribbon-helix-helix protein, CopG family [Methylococcus sp.]|jgi:plasmid stability protein